MAISTVNVTGVATTTYISSGDTAITFMSLCNHGPAPVSCNIYIVPNGDIPTLDNLFVLDLEIIAGDTYVVYQGGEKLIVENGDSVVVLSNSANDVAVLTSYVAV